jgi:hypothetical protein
MAVAAFGGYIAANIHASANNHAGETLNLAGEEGAASRQNVTLHACLAAGKITSVSAAAPPKCPAKSIPIQWSAQFSPVTAPNPVPSASPSPSASASASASQTPTASPTGAACVSSADNGICGPYSFAGIIGGGNQTNVIQDVWNPIAGASQKLTAIDPGDWSVSANMPASNTAVLSYPDTQQVYTTTHNTPDPLSSFSSITSSFTVNGPTTGGDDYEAAYDIWTGTGSDNYSHETMIWVDNHGQKPAGSDVASATIDGVGYSIWSTSKAGALGDPVSMVLDANESSGSVNVLDDLNWLMSNGYMPADSGLNQLDFGFEICSTGGASQTFSVSQFGIKSP